MHADVFSVIADSTRRRIVRLLAEQTHTVGAVVEKLGMSQPTISKHLKVLREAGVVSAVVEGQRRLYSLNPEVFTEITDWVGEILEAARASAAAHAPVALPGGESFSPAFPGSSVVVGGFTGAHQHEVVESSEKLDIPAELHIPSDAEEDNDEEPSAEDNDDTAAGGSEELQRRVVPLSSNNPNIPAEDEPAVEEGADSHPDPAVGVVLSAKAPEEPAETAESEGLDEELAGSEQNASATFAGTGEVSEGVVPMRPFTPSAFASDEVPQPDEEKAPVETAAKDSTNETQSVAPAGRGEDDEATESSAGVSPWSSAGDASAKPAVSNEPARGKHEAIDTNPANEQPAKSEPVNVESQDAVSAAADMTSTTEDVPTKKTHHHAGEDTAASATESQGEQKTAGLFEAKTGQDAADSPRIEASTAEADRDAASVEAAAVSKIVKSDETALMADPADGPDADEDVAAHADDAEPKKTYAEGKGADPEASEDTEAADTDGASVTDTADAGAEPETVQTVEPKEAPEPTEEPVFRPIPQPAPYEQVTVKEEPRGLLARVFGRRR